MKYSELEKMSNRQLLQRLEDLSSGLEHVSGECRQISAYKWSCEGITFYEYIG